MRFSKGIRRNLLNLIDKGESPIVAELQQEVDIHLHTLRKSDKEFRLDYQEEPSGVPNTEEVVSIPDERIPERAKTSINPDDIEKSNRENTIDFS